MPVKIVAELSGNHNGSLSTALELCDIAKECGADAVKTQCFDPVRLAKAREGKMDAAVGTPWEGVAPLDLYKQTAVPMKWHYSLMEHCTDIGLDYFASVFSQEDVEFMVDKIGVDTLKIASIEAEDGLFLKACYDTQKDIVVSIKQDISDRRLKRLADRFYSATKGNRPRLTMLQCVPEYPAESGFYSMGFQGAISHRAYLTTCGNIAHGISDHTQSLILPIAATAVGATMIERHLCKSNQDPSPDAFFSTEPKDFKRMVEAVRETEKML